MKTLFIGSKSTGSDARRIRWGVLASSLAAVALLAAPLAIDIGSNGASGLIGSAKAAPRLCDDGTRPPCDDGGGNEPPDFGDLIKLYRDPSGVPYLTADSCWQPLASDDCPATCVLVEGDPAGQSVIPVDTATCAVTAACAICTQEVDFGRINEARSPDEVFASQLEDVVVSLVTADQVTLDPAGRLVASTCDSTLDNLAKTIDSPLQNLAIYRELILTGTIGAPLPEGADILDTAARGLGAASDKAGEVDVDLVAYLNQIMGLSDPLTTTILDPKICIDRKQEVQGVVQLVQECFLDYSAYIYARLTNFGALPAPAYIPEGAPEEGWFEYLSLVPETDPPLFQILYGPITTAVFTDEPGFADGNIGGFAQASDDARAVIAYMHENQVPVDFETAVPCVPSEDIFYDLSISEQSGLQVPKNYVNGGEREFFVNVVNLGPDTANGTVTVVATVDSGTIDCGVATDCTWTENFTDLLAGQTDSSTVFFTINTTSDTINWTATVVADPPGTDPNLGNNSVSAVSSVRASGGGGNPN